MAVELKVTGNGRFRGAQTALESYTVSEEATPVDPADTSGGAGQFSFNVVEDPAAEGTILLYGDTVELTDSSNGRTTGKVSTINAANTVASVTADSRMARLVTDVNAQPFSGTLGNALTYYFGLGSITSGISIDPTIASRTVALQGFVGNLWDNLKQICAAHQIEMSLVSNNVVVRPLRTRIAESLKQVSQTLNVSTSAIAQNVEVMYYNNTFKSDLVYPTGGWTADIQSYQVDAGQSITINIPVNVSVFSVSQPTCVLFVGRYDTANSVYAVAGNDGLPITPAQWNNTGGSLTVAVGKDTKSLDVTITGSSETKYAPYTIAVTAGPSDRYSSLRIRGTGIFFDQRKLTIPTGLTSADTPNLVGATIDNRYISTLGQAQDVGVIAAGRYAGPSQIISIDSLVVNRKGEVGNINYPTFATFDSLYPTQTYDQFDASWSGQSFDQFDAYTTSLVQDAFENQAFGNVAGARVRFRDTWYRIRSATITQTGISYSAERDNLFSDLEVVWPTETFATYDARWAGKTFGDMDLINLWR